MSKRERIDLTGHVFNRLTVIKKSENIGKETAWECLCSCGNTFVTRTKTIRAGEALSCGCLQREVAKNTGAAKAKDLAGMVFGRLTVIERSGSSRNKATWKCACTCGAESVVVGQRLVSGKTASCGCLALELKAARKRTHGRSRTREYENEIGKRRYHERKSDPLFAFKVRSRSLISCSMRLKGNGFKKAKKTEEILGCSLEFFFSHIERQFHDGMSWELMCNIEIDHIVPVSSANSIEEVVALSHFTNLRPMWSVDNQKKRNSRDFLI